MRVASITLGVPLHGYGAMRPAPPLPPEPVHLLCPTEAPPALYALPERHTMSVTPDEYVTERDVREGRHAGLAAELDAYRAVWLGCPRPVSRL